MLIVASDAHRRHVPRTPFLDRGIAVAPPEVPERADRILRALRDAKLGDPREARQFDDTVLRAVHSPQYLDFLEHAHARWCTATGLGPESEAVAYARAIRGETLPEAPNVIAALGWHSHDNDPVLEGTWAAARAAVDVTLTAWQAVADGREHSAYALTRPPGHHAAVDSFAGYCYLNNAAVAAQAWTARGARVAIVDVDYHHGNGTQRIFYARDDVFFASLHADPADEYPFFTGFARERGEGAGEGCTYNVPLPAGTAWDRYALALDDALAAVRSYAPDAIVVSLGVDTAAEDPDRFELHGDDYTRLGAALATLDRPMLVVQEGGYCLDVLGRNVANALRELG